MKQNFSPENKAVEVADFMEPKKTRNSLNSDVLFDLDTALANDAYYTLQSLLKDEDDDYNDDDVELNYEKDRKLLVRVRALHHERCRIFNNYIRYKNRYQERLLKIKDMLDCLGVNLEETEAVYKENGLDWEVY